MSKTSKEVLNELEALREQLKNAQLALKLSKSRAEKQFRTETTQSANNFHIGFNQIYSADEIREKYAHLFIETDTENNCDVYKSELRRVLIADTVALMNSAK
jgi:hypothetical protein